MPDTTPWWMTRPDVPRLLVRDGRIYTRLHGYRSRHQAEEEAAHYDSGGSASLLREVREEGWVLYTLLNAEASRRGVRQAGRWGGAAGKFYTTETRDAEPTNLGSIMVVIGGPYDSHSEAVSALGTRGVLRPDPEWYGTVVAAYDREASQWVEVD